MDVARVSTSLRPCCLFEGCGARAWRRSLCKDHWKFVREDDALDQFPAELTVRRSKADGSGFVYVMHADGLHKVGMTRCLTSRLLSIRAAMTSPVELVYCAKTANPLGVEAAAHRLLKAFRAKGEWFACTQAQAAEAVNEAIGNPIVKPKRLKSERRRLRPRPLGYFDHSPPVTRINPNGRKHPDLILE